MDMRDQDKDGSGGGGGEFKRVRGGLDEGYKWLRLKILLLCQNENNKGKVSRFPYSKHHHYTQTPPNPPNTPSPSSSPTFSQNLPHPNPQTPQSNASHKIRSCPPNYPITRTPPPPNATPPPMPAQNPNPTLPRPSRSPQNQSPAPTENCPASRPTQKKTEI